MLLLLRGVSFYICRKSFLMYFHSFIAGYVSQILDDARVYANYAKKTKTIEMDDVKLAVLLQMEKSFTSPPPRDVRELFVN